MTSEVRSANTLKIPILMGVLIGAVKIILSTIQKGYLENYRTSTILFMVSIIATILLLPVTGMLQKKVLGSQPMLKDMFRAILITIVIGVSLSFFYDHILLSTDPTMADRIYKGQVEYVKTLPHATERLGELKKNYELDKTQSPGFLNLTTQLLSYIVWYSILGFIFALALTRKKAA